MPRVRSLMEHIYQFSLPNRSGAVIVATQQRSVTVNGMRNASRTKIKCGEL